LTFDVDVDLDLELQTHPTRDQTSLPRELGSNSFSSFRDISYTNKTRVSSCWDWRSFGHNRLGPKSGGAAVPPFWGTGSPSNTMSLGPRPISLPSSILIYGAVWPQQTRAKIRGLFPYGGAESHLTQCGQSRGLPPCKWHLDPSNRLATIHQRYRQIDRQTDRTGQNRTGQTTVR